MEGEKSYTYLQQEDATKHWVKVSQISFDAQIIIRGHLVSRSTYINIFWLFSPGYRGAHICRSKSETFIWNLECHYGNQQPILANDIECFTSILSDFQQSKTLFLQLPLSHLKFLLYIVFSQCESQYLEAVVATECLSLLLHWTAL